MHSWYIAVLLPEGQVSMVDNTAETLHAIKDIAKLLMVAAIRVLGTATQVATRLQIIIVFMALKISW